MSPDWQIRAAMGVMVLYFGSSFTAYAAAEESFGFVTINAFRFVLASLLLLAISRGRLSTVRHVRGRLLLAGAYGVGLMAILMAYGVDRATPTLASLVMALESPGIALAAAFVARDRPTRAALVSLAIGFSGAAIASGALTEPPGEVPFLAVGALLGAVVSFSIYAATIRRTAPTADPLAVATVVQIGAAMFAAPLLLLDVLDQGIVRDTPDFAAIFSVDHHRRRLGARLLADVERARQGDGEPLRRLHVPAARRRRRRGVDRARRRTVRPAPGRRRAHPGRRVGVGAGCVEGAPPGLSRAGRFRLRPPSA